MPEPLSTEPAPLPAACLNCGVAFASPRPRFCPACGQETNVKPPRIGEFLQQFGGAYFATEGALWRTLKLLLFKPGELTRQYLAGRRKHYVLPLRLYLTISVVVLLLLRVVGSSEAVKVDLDAAQDQTRGRRGNMIGQFGGGRAGLRDGVFFCEDLPAWVCKRVQRRIDLDPKALLVEIDNLRDRFIGNLGAAMFVLLPSFALWLKLVYPNRRLRYTEHLVFALHVHAFWFVALAFTLPGTAWLGVPALIAAPWYTLAAMRRVYGGRRWPRLLRAAFVSVLYGLTLALALGAVGLWTLLA